MGYGRSRDALLPITDQGGVTDVTVTVTLTGNQRVVRADATGGAIVVTMPEPSAARAFQIYVVQRESVAANNVTVAFPGGAADPANVVLGTQWFRAVMFNDGSRWHVLA